MSEATPAPRDLERLAFARAHLGPAAPVPERASSDAGFRSYWRTRAADGSPRIVMDSPPDREDVRPWLAMQARLRTGGVRVPGVLAQDPENGWLLLEDLGANTVLQVIDADSADRWIGRAFEQLVRLQRIALPDGFPAYDEALVRRELALFPEWFLGRHLGLALTPSEERVWQAACAVLVAAFRNPPQGLVHRDFIVRNLMPAGDGVAVLDFQDAVRGPLAYDVLSLTKDAFVSWPQARVNGWISDYHHAARDAGLSRADPEAFRRDLDLIGVQRHLKVLGIFARLLHRDAKPRYLADAPRFLAYLDHTLPQYPELADLHALLAQRVFPRITPMALPA
ncbi:aminoglycoside phosphotransferase family protein [Denitratimonas tolerans]|uniref:Phosphotransferase n=1 Tax=Denitratimonas tolerans TaxID=1338420 RepID=A0AAW9R3X4_9GAMM